MAAQSNIIFFKTQTTGLPTKLDPTKPLTDGKDIRMVGLSWIVITPIGNIVKAADYIIKATNFEIPENTIQFHHITKEKSLALGVEAKAALNEFMDDVKTCNIKVCHNVQFDKLIVNHEMYLSGMLAKILFFIGPTWVDTMRDPRFYDPKAKWPTLPQLYNYHFPEKTINSEASLLTIVNCIVEIYVKVMNITLS